MESKVSQVVLAVGLFLVGIISGTLGFILIEGMTTVDAVYMTVITMSTVGFGEVQTLSESGKVFTSLFILYNLGTFTYFISLFSKFIFEGEFRVLFWDYRSSKGLKKMQNHVIVCGFGRYGYQAVKELDEKNEPYVVIEINQKVVKKRDLSKDQKKHILVGDANDEEVLKKACIGTAKALIAAMPEDASNVFVSLSAKELNPNLKIIARAGHESSRKKLMSAGADHVILPDMIGGNFMASLVTRPQVMGFLSSIAGWSDDKIVLEEFDYDDLRDEYKGKNLREFGASTNFNVKIVGYREGFGNYNFNPKADLHINKNGVMIALGSPVDIERFKESVTQL